MVAAGVCAMDRRIIRAVGRCQLVFRGVQIGESDVYGGVLNGLKRRDGIGGRREEPIRAHLGEQGDAGGYAAIGISSTSRSMSGYQRLKMVPSSPLSVSTRVCNNKCAPSLDHCICCFLQNRLLTTSLTVDSTNPVAIA